MKNIRIGTGFDVHKLVTNRPLIIGGVEIPYKLGLLGHSDADVLLHALSDSLLGAAALGDIGHAFPDDKPETLGMSSRKILQDTFQRLQALNYKINNLDATILAEKPKMQPYLSQMRTVIANICQIDVSQVNIKATTMEKQGFIGQEAAIAAQAVALIYQ